ncbi:GGDEF domain-containing protein [candidate division TA06 bacterium]|uniref:GGDEF domain-containing protein n=1 Tax=candidate division TA06 bacterium TaxID=2250710 RepID=A0A523UVA3_UNCT6|nr:MAG: GGDEF domain-containing protein [candidate division TA06 bacterium]
MAIAADKLVALLRPILLLAALAAVKLGAGKFHPIIEADVNVLVSVGVLYTLITAYFQFKGCSIGTGRFCLAIDFALISVIVLRTGGLESNFALLYLLPIVQSSFVHGFRDTATIAGVVWLVLISLAISQGPNTKVVTPLYWKALIYGAFAGVLWLSVKRFEHRPRSHERQVRELTALVHLTSALESSLDIDETSEASLDIILPIFDAQIGAITILGAGNNLVTRASRGLSKTNWSAVRKLTRETIGTKQGRVVEKQLARDDIDEPSSSDAASLLFAPLLVRESIVGVLLVGKQYPHQWDHSETALLKIIADRLAAYIDSVTLYDETRRLAITDELTGAHNHGYFRKRVEEEIKRADRYNRPLSLVMIDVDQFKEYNDIQGHQMGDEVLKGIANTLKRWTRLIDVVSRYGEDEFAVILPETDEEGSMTVARRLKKRIEDTYFPFESSQPSGCITVSMGIATFPENAVSAKELIKNAIDALDNAKLKGNTLCSAASQLVGVEDLVNQLVTKWKRT